MSATVFALIPWFTIGFGSVFAFGLAALFLRGVSRRATTVLVVSAAVYAVALAVFFATVDDTPDDSLSPVATTALLVMFIGGGIEAAACSPLIAGLARGSFGQLDEIVKQERNEVARDPAVRRAIQQRERRDLARKILADDRALANTLHIGRPDLKRDFADGGLVDVNHCPISVFLKLPGIDRDMATRIVSARERLDGLRSPADLVVEADIPSEVVDGLKDVLVFPLDEP
ncbi:MAG TPA: hypothetical protein VH442_07655 [Micromonosporaceae bacterium]